MPSAAKQIEWCTVRLGDDQNWWVVEVSDVVHWDVDGLSIIDPKQVSHLIDLTEPMREYSFDPDTLDGGFIAFKIQKDLGDGVIRLVRSKESFFDTDEPLFALPDVVDEENGPYADFLNHITRVRVRMLNDLINFEQKLTIDELEEEIREEENNSFIEGKAVHLFHEVTSILDYVPVGWELDSDDEEDSDEIDDFPDIDEDEEEAKQLSKDSSLKWDEDEESEEEDDDSYEGGPVDGDEDKKEDEQDDEDEVEIEDKKS